MATPCFPQTSISYPLVDQPRGVPDIFAFAMEVLSTSNPFQAPVSSSARSLLPCRAPAPSIVSRRTSRHSSETQRNGKAGAVSTLHDDALGTSIKHATSVALSTGEGRSTRRLTISGFLPLPSITASPVCTPSPSMSSQSFDYADAKEGSAAASRSSEEFATAPSTPCASLLQVLITPPTWISTPPTPPRTLVRRSATCLSPRSSAPLVPSASLPALAPPHVLARKRCSSLPAMSMRLRTRSEPLVKFQSTQISRGQTLSRSPLQDAKVTPRAPALRARPIFHISNEGYTDNEDNGSLTTETRERSHEETSAEGGSSDHSLDVRWHSEKSKDNIRKYHALMELLTTEVGYLIDLRALVTVSLFFKSQECILIPCPVEDLPQKSPDPGLPHLHVRSRFLILHFEPMDQLLFPSSYISTTIVYHTL